MAKIILGQRPKNFPHTVKFPQLSGEPGSMGVTYIYRTRSEFGDFADEIKAEIKTEVDADMAMMQNLIDKKLPIPELSQKEIVARQTKRDVAYVMRCIEGWDLAVPFDHAAVEQLADEVPAAITAICSDYREAITEGRLGN